jgi:hypothetical protein
MAHTKIERTKPSPATRAFDRGDLDLAGTLL